MNDYVDTQDGHVRLSEAASSTIPSGTACGRSAGILPTEPECDGYLPKIGMAFRVSTPATGSDKLGQTPVMAAPDIAFRRCADETETTMITKDISTALTHQLSTILEDCRRIEPALQDYLKVRDERPDINFELLRILSNALSAYALIEPDKEAGEFHGLPRAACSTGESTGLQIRHTERDAEWEFRPWLSEKLNRLQGAAKDLVGIWLTDPSSVVLHKEAPVTARVWLRQMIALHFGELKQKATTVFEEVCSDRLEIKQTERKSGP